VHHAFADAFEPAKDYGFPPDAGPSAFLRLFASVRWIFLDPRQNTIAAIWEDIVKRRYITVGMLAFVAMVPLAITSTAGWVRRLTFKRWKQLHRLIYLTAVAAVIHYYWLVKSDVRLPLMYAAFVTVLLGCRIIAWMRKRKASTGRAPQPTISVG
jgi:sulfoxide reductase heme-binding subunit YedZ